jgi:hypothetical protein
MTKAASCHVAVTLSQRSREPTGDSLFSAAPRRLRSHPAKPQGDASKATPVADPLEVHRHIGSQTSGK